jgi:hypothetical protein
LRSTRPALRIHAITPEGFHQGQLTVRHEDGAFHFRTGPWHAALYYLIQAV